MKTTRILKGPLGRKRGQRGVTLVELALSLTIAAVVAAGVMLLLSNANNNQKIDAFIKELGIVQSSVQGLYAGQNNYTSLTAADLASTDLLPSKMVNAAGTTIYHSFKGTLALASVAAAANAQFTVTASDVPDDACPRIVSSDFGRTVVSIQVNANAASVNPLTAAQARAQCVADPNSIVWTFK